MDILDVFYRRTYEFDINNKMLHYDYTFPTEEVMDYVQQILCLPIDQLVQHDIESETGDAITPKDVFQFSSLENATDNICRILNNIGNPGVTYLQAGKLLLNDGKSRNDIAYKKYGENHLKTAEALGLLYELAHTYFVSCIGTIYLILNDEDRKRLNIRLLLRNKFIAQLVKATSTATVNARQFLYMLSDTTYTRRKSNVKYILQYMQESTEYDFSQTTSKIHFS